VGAGSPLLVTLASEAALPAETFRVVHLELVTPEGMPYDLYTRNVRFESTAHQERIDLAYNDPAGRWQLNAYDLMTGRVIQTAFTLRTS
jgi:hypothetical protein